MHGGSTIVGRVRAAARSAELGEQDAVLVTLKANMLDAFAEQSAPLLRNSVARKNVLAESRIPPTR